MSAAKKKKVPCVLAIGGLDPGGGAGVLADARAIARTGAFPCAAVAVLTVQSTSGLRDATPVAKTELLAECTEVVRHQRVRAFKVGALGSDENTRVVGDFLAIHRDLPSVVDTVMMPSRGRARLLEEKAIGVLRTRLLPQATLVMCNAPEAEVLTGLRVTRLSEAREAAVALLRLGARAVLVKGGHLGGSQATDVLALAGPPPPPASAKSLATVRARRAADANVIELVAPRLTLPPIHGGGCAFASLVAGRLARKIDDWKEDPARALEAAVRWGKDVHHEALAEARDAGGDMRVLFA